MSRVQSLTDGNRSGKLVKSTWATVFVFELENKLDPPTLIAQTLKMFRQLGGAVPWSQEELGSNSASDT